MPVTEAPFRRGEKVIATQPIAHVPEGAQGEVMLVDGFAWIRYWVHFDDGTEMGSIDHGSLVRAKEWNHYITERANAEAGVGAADDGDTGDAAAGGGDSGSGGEGATVNGVAVPGYLLDRSKTARVRLGG